MGEEAEKLPRYQISKYEPSKRADGDKDEYVPDGDEVDEDDEDEEFVPDDESSTSQGDEPVVYHNRTKRFLKSSMKNTQNFDIFHCIPRDMLKSLALGTVACNYYLHWSKAPRGGHKIPKKGGYGIYAFGLSVKDRDGKWLAATELQVLVRNLEKYVAAYEAWSNNDNSWPLTLRSIELHDFVIDVDSRIGKYDKSGPRYVTSEAAKDGMLAMASSMQRRVDESLKLGPTGSTQMIQTPLFVGLSTSLADRMPKHVTANNNESALEGSKTRGGGHAQTAGGHRLFGLDDE
jgi:hypothetical protein